MRSFVAVLLAGTLFCSMAAAQDQKETVITKILLRTLAFDRSFGDRAGTQIVFAVVYYSQNESSMQEMKAMVEELAKARGRKIAGRLLEVRTVDCANPTELSGLSEGTHAVFITGGLGSNLDAILAETKKHNIPTLAASRAHVQRGVAIGVVLEDERARLIINLPASKAAGMALSSNMLRMAEVIR